MIYKAVWSALLLCVLASCVPAPSGTAAEPPARLIGVKNTFTTAMFSDIGLVEHTCPAANTGTKQPGPVVFSRCGLDPYGFEYFRTQWDYAAEWGGHAVPAPQPAHPWRHSVRSGKAVYTRTYNFIDTYPYTVMYMPNATADGQNLTLVTY